MMPLYSYEHDNDCSYVDIPSSKVVKATAPLLGPKFFPASFEARIATTSIDLARLKATQHSGQCIILIDSRIHITVTIWEY